MLHLYTSGRDQSGGPRSSNIDDLAAIEDLRLAKSALRNPAAAQQLLERLAPRIRRAVQMMVGSDQDADDLTQHCLVEVLGNLGRYRGTGPIEAWAGRLTYRVLMRALSRRSRRARTETPEELDHFPASSLGTPEYATHGKQVAERLLRHLQKMPTERRVTLVYRLVYHYSVGEVATLMAVPLNTVRDRIRVGLKELRESILRDADLKDLLDEGRGKNERVL